MSYAATGQTLYGLTQLSPHPCILLYVYSDQLPRTWGGYHPGIFLCTFHARARGSGARAQAARVGRTPRDSGAAWSVCVSMPRAKKISCYHFTFLSSGCTRPARSCRQLADRVMMVQVTDGRAGTRLTDERSGMRGIGLGGLHAARFRRTLDPR